VIIPKGLKVYSRKKRRRSPDLSLIQQAGSAAAACLNGGMAERFDFQLGGAVAQSAVEQSSSDRAPVLGEIGTSVAGEVQGLKEGFLKLGTPGDIVDQLNNVGYQCLPYLAVQLGLLLNSPSGRVRALLLEGPSGCGKSFMAKSLAKITGAEFFCLSCYQGMRTENLIEAPSSFALAQAMGGKGVEDPSDLMNLGVITRAFLKSREKPVILLVDELDKPDIAIDTFFLGPIQDSAIWLESRDPVEANPDNILIIFTKNYNRKIDDALLRRVHPIRMTYLSSELEQRILEPHCHPQLVKNLIGIAERMRRSEGSYQFERPPAPEELLAAGHYVSKLLKWGIKDFTQVGSSIWSIISKSEHDRAVFEHMLRFHPDYMDPLKSDGRSMKIDDVHAKLGRLLLDKIVDDPDAKKREDAWKDLEYH